MDGNNHTTEQATIAGGKAFNDGKPCTPALDRNCMALIEGTNGQALNILGAWISGWTKANLNAEIK